MTKIFIVSDTHFNHSTMIEQGWRGFRTVESMNEFIISQWNKTVGKEDTVYHLGDVVMNIKEHFYTNILPRLNGKIIFIRGNHDNQKMSMIDNLIISWRGEQYELVHSPYNCTESVKIVLHGHIHQSGRRASIGKCIKPHLYQSVDFITYYNCNLEFHKYKPKLLNEIVGECKSKSL